MSYNLLLGVEQEDHDMVVRPMTLTRALTGLTHSAHLAMGDHIDFEGIQVEITQIIHNHVPPGEQIGPNTTALCRTWNNRALFDIEIDLLMKHGWRDC